MAKKQRSVSEVKASGGVSVRKGEVSVRRIGFLSAGIFGAYLVAAAWAVALIYTFFSVSVSAYGRGMMMNGMMTPYNVVGSFVALVALGFVWGLVVAVFYNAFAQFGALKFWVD